MLPHLEAATALRAAGIAFPAGCRGPGGRFPCPSPRAPPPSGEARLPLHAGTRARPVCRIAVGVVITGEPMGVFGTEMGMTAPPVGVIAERWRTAGAPVGLSGADLGTSRPSTEVIATGTVTTAEAARASGQAGGETATADHETREAGRDEML